MFLIFLQLFFVSFCCFDFIFHFLQIFRHKTIFALF